MDPVSPTTIRPHQRWQQEGQFETDTTGRYGPDVIAGFEGCTVKRLSREACLRVTETDSRLQGAVVGDEIVEAIIVYIR